MALGRILKSAGVDDIAQQAFIDWGSLERVSRNVLHFVSPILTVNEVNLAEALFRRAFQAYEKGRRVSPAAAYRAYIDSLPLVAKDLAKLRISVQSEDGLWEIWSYDEPLMDKLKHRQDRCVQVREREEPVDARPIAIKLLSMTVPTDELGAFGFELKAVEEGLQ